MKDSLNIITGLMIGVLLEAALQFLGQLLSFKLPLLWAMCTGIVIVFSIIIGISLACNEIRCKRKEEKREAEG